MRPFGTSVDYNMGTVSAPEGQSVGWYELTTAIIAFLCVVGCLWFTGGTQ